MGSKHYSQQQKLSILESSKKLGIKKAAEVAGVHYTSVYNWRHQYKALGKDAFLAHQPKYPGRGSKQITEKQEKAILNTWQQNPGFGPGQVRNQLRRQGETISVRTVRAVMQANGYQHNRRKRNSEKPHRFEASRPLELVQIDILEFFINKLKVYLILMLDDFSRFIYGFRLLTETSTDAIIELVRQSIDRYGKMQEILTDRGFVFFSWRGINRFERYLQNEGIDHTHARPHHPQTLGKVEACNRRIKSELFDQQHFAGVDEAQIAIERYVENYNYRRTHQGIGGLLVPAERFHGRTQQAMPHGIEALFAGGEIERSIFSLVAGPGGRLTLQIMGQPILLKGASHDREVDSGRSGDFGPRP